MWTLLLILIGVLFISILIGLVCASIGTALLSMISTSVGETIGGFLLITVAIMCGIAGVITTVLLYKTIAMNIAWILIA